MEQVQIPGPVALVTLALLVSLGACAPDLGDKSQSGVANGYDGGIGGPPYGGAGYAPDYIAPGYAAPFYDTPDPTSGVFLGNGAGEEPWRHRDRNRDRGPGVGHGAPSQFPPGLSGRAPAPPLRPPPAPAMAPPVAPRPPSLAAIPRPTFAAPPRPMAAPAPPPRIAPPPPRAPGVPWPP